jgi:DNA (cytosine-5)-methyltransferase 1
MNFYNEWDGYAAGWLRNLGAGGHIPIGKVDERSIKDVSAEDLEGFTQAHFFAGIGGWPLALRLAGWPEDREVWTGSCPCQPFSVAGKAAGLGDERHLWPAFHRLIAERRPSIVFGEQVASADGRQWLSGVSTDLEDLGYAVGAADLCAAGVASPHCRQRLYWVAVGDSDLKGLEGLHDARRRVDLQPASAAVRRQWEAEPRLDRVANGVPARVGKLRAYGNAIVPQVAAEFIGAYLDVSADKG